MLVTREEKGKERGGGEEEKEEEREREREEGLSLVGPCSKNKNIVSLGQFIKSVFFPD